jgi:hypothetical protein
MGLPDLSFQSSVALPIGISFYIFHSCRTALMSTEAAFAPRRRGATICYMWPFSLSWWRAPLSDGPPWVSKSKRPVLS